MAERLRAELVAGFKSRFHFDNVRRISKEAVCACMSDPRVANLVWCHPDANLAPQTEMYKHFRQTYIDALVEQQLRLAPAVHPQAPAGIAGVAASAAVAGHNGNVAAAGLGVAGGPANAAAMAAAAAAAVPLPISGGLFLPSRGRTGNMMPSFHNFLSAQNSAVHPAVAAPATSARAEKIRRVTEQVDEFMAMDAMPMMRKVGEKLVANDPMLFWKNRQQANDLKLLLPMVRRSMCIPASEAPSERVFSKLAILIGRLRNRLSPDLASDIMFLGCNRKLFRKINLALSPDDL